ncbi:MAG: NRDE family protein, partial [Natronospirillum sp.]
TLAPSRANRRSRGELVLNALVQPQPLPELLAGQLKEGHEYQGFNLLAADADGLYYGSNRASKVQRLNPGLYGLSNATLDVPWPKVRRACSAMAAFVAEPGALETLAGLLRDTQTAPDGELPDTGLDYQKEKALSAQFIRLPDFDYGTRASTAVMIDRQGTVHLFEQNYFADGQLGHASSWEVPNFWSVRHSE